MDATLIDRKRQSALAKSKVLYSELERWRIDSERGAPLEKHNSQIRRVAARLRGLLGNIDVELNAESLDILSQGRAIEEKLLTAHVIWEFFRSKFVQRLDGNLREYLRVCDELAWACYEPVRQQFLAQPANAQSATAVKEPPLVFLNGGWSPFALGRDSAFQVERVAGGWLAQQDFRRIVESLPVPLIGVPWYQVAHLPDAVVIAHEVGHIVEWDFHLTPDLTAALDTAQIAGSPEAWRAWRPEVFADLFGCLALGPAFAATLMDFLAQDKARLDADKRNVDAWGAYPPAWLRAKLMIETLRLLGADVSELGQRHFALFGEPKSNLEFGIDAGTVARALLECRCSTMLTPPDRGARAPCVRELLPPLSRNPTCVARSIMSEYQVYSEDARVLIAAARHAWEIDPSRYLAADRDRQICSLIPSPPGTRGTPKANIDARETEEQETGVHWLDDLYAEAARTTWSSRTGIDSTRSLTAGSPSTT
jgi:hypothetical protein